MPLQFYALLGEGEVELYFLNSLHLFVIWNPFNFQMESLMRVMGGVGAAWDLPVSAVLSVPSVPGASEVAGGGGAGTQPSPTPWAEVRAVCWEEEGDPALFIY